MIEVITSSINESLSDYPLYHNTDLASFEAIVRDNLTLRGYEEGYKWACDRRGRVAGRDKKYISLTRDKRFNFSVIKFEFSRKQLGDRYKIKPYYEDDSEIDASEEVLVADKIDLKKYLVSIEVNKTNKSEYKDLVKGFNDVRKYNIIYNKALEGYSYSCDDSVPYLIYLVQRLGIKCGPNLNNLLNLVGKDAWKYIRVYPFNKEKVELPKLSAKSQELLDKLKELENKSSYEFNNNRKKAMELVKEYNELELQFESVRIKEIFK